jgi:hypothetical protein
MSIAGRTQTLEMAEAIIGGGSTPPQLIDPRTGKPLAQSSVYLVTMAGRFAIARHVPENEPVPTGTRLSLVIDAALGYVSITSLSNTAPRLPEAINPAGSTRRGRAIVTTPTPEPAGSTPRTGGHVDYVGGPPPGIKESAPEGLLVRVEGARGRVVARAHTGPRGNFHVRLVPGRYTFAAYLTASPYSRCIPRHVTVRRAAFVFLACSIK